MTRLNTLGAACCVALAALMTQGCGDDGSGKDPRDVKVETWNVALAGAFIPFEMERRIPVTNAVPTTDADILCLQEVWEQADKDAIQAAAASEFPHAYFVANDLDTQLDDATDQNGTVPTPPTGVPCPDVEVGGTNIADQVDVVTQCLTMWCITPDGKTESASCAAANCTDEVGPLFPTEQGLRCYACAVTQLPTETIESIGQRCKTIENQDLAFRGQNGVMILSRYPLSNEQTFVMPGTWNRRVISSATATLPSGAELDVYCNHLTPIFNDPLLFPYTGLYGADGVTSPEKWEAEQLLQAGKLVDYVEAESGARPAVILGDLNAGREVRDADDNIVLYNEGAPTLDLLETSFVQGVTSDFEPLCTFCDTNPLNGTEDTLPVWIDHVYLYNLDASTVQSTARTFDESVVPVEEDGMSMMVPLSDHFGLASVIRVPDPE